MKATVGLFAIIKIIYNYRGFSTERLESYGILQMRLMYKRWFLLLGPKLLTSAAETWSAENWKVGNVIKLLLNGKSHNHKLIKICSKPLGNLPSLAIEYEKLQV